MCKYREVYDQKQVTVVAECRQSMQIPFRQTHQRLLLCAYFKITDDKFEKIKCLCQSQNNEIKNICK